jgi:hypothetical protein
MPAAEVRPTIVVELTVMMCVGSSRREVHEVGAGGSCCGSRWKEVELCCGATHWLNAIRVWLGWAFCGCLGGADGRSEGGTRRASGVGDGDWRDAVVAMLGEST